MFDRLKSDIRCVLERDPAARSGFEVFLCYPGFHAVRNHRFAHFLYTHGFRFSARLVSELSRFFTGVEIHPGAVIGKKLFIDHGMGVVIGETTVIGDNVTLYQGVTLGGTGKESGKRHPNIGSNVMVASGARVLGPITVGDYAKIGSGAVVLRDVPPYATVVGVPGRVVKIAGCPHTADGSPACRPDEKDISRIKDCPSMNMPPKSKDPIDLDQVNLPDPIEMELTRLRSRLAALEKALEQQTKKE
ncbi:MAG: serine O-acetyltransferase [Clostridiales bacterium]|nr:serine O-acetyltransferase [Clostridiales bacterium]